MGSGDPLEQSQLITQIYQRIAEKKPQVIQKLYYLGRDLSQVATSADDSSQADENSIQNEVVTTQVAQVAYHLRQKKRAFDTACLLELLNKDFLGRSKCIETSRDLSKSPSDEFRPKIFSVTKNAKMVQLLLALSKDPQGDQNRSDFSSKYLKNKMKSNQNATLFVKPHLADYVQADCQWTERDKTMGGRQAYLNYDTNSFQNPKFSTEALQDMGGVAQPYKLDSLTSTDVNRFNFDLVKAKQNKKSPAQSGGESNNNNFQVGISASGGQEPTPLLGATLRSLDQVSNVVKSNQTGLFGAQGAIFGSSTSAFGITLQVPSLPPIDKSTIFHKDGTIESTQIQPTFSFFQPPAPQKQESLATVTAAAAIKLKGGRLTITAPSTNPNRRQQKQANKQKVKKEKLSVWQLLPYVNESVLDNNMEKESGISRMWEDDSLHLQMRNLSVCEPGVITAQKEASFRTCFKASVGSVIRVPGSSKTIREKDLVRSLILVLQGIPSKQVFELDKTTFTFNTNPNLVISDLCCTSASLQQLCDEFTQAGCYFLHLREFSEFMSSHESRGAGQVVEAFALAIQDFLIFYQHQVNELERKARLHRQSTSKNTEDGQQQQQEYLSLLEIMVLMAPLLAQIQTIASICFTLKFIEDIQLQQQMKKGEAEDAEADDSANQSIDDEFKFMSLLYQRNALTADNLKEQLRENLEKIRSEQWLNEFPRGAKLLTYLYRIMLASEADLQVIDLLRRIFTQSVRPILLMISEFITIGSFEDPFNEFFVEKLYRNNNNQDGKDENQQESMTTDSTGNEFIFKLTSDLDKIPVFFNSNDTAVTIFKIGCDLNLLKTKRQQILTETHQQAQIQSEKDSFTKVNLPDYFAICARGHPENVIDHHRRTPMVDHASRVLTLDFSMETLQKKDNADSKLFEHQSELLQRIEQQIAQEETDALLKHIQLREKAAIFRMTESEKERQRTIGAREEKKRQLMQQIQDDINQRQQNREAKEQQVKDERERQRQEQAEYEKIKKGIAQNLKQQLMDILKENQSIADTRTGDAIQKEALEQQVDELERKAEQAQQEVTTAANQMAKKSDDVLMTAPDEEEKNQLMKPDEEMILEVAGKVSSTVTGGLAKVLFGKGEKQESEEEEVMRKVIDDESSNSPKSAAVDLEDIQLDLAADEKAIIDQPLIQDNPEKLPEETAQETEQQKMEKVAFIQKVFISPLLSRVFKFIDEKQSMDSKRKTWNLKHQLDQVEDLKSKKANWDYHSSQKSSLQSRMDAIFQEYEEEETQILGQSATSKQQQSVDQPTKDDQLMQVPITLAIEQSIIQVVKHQHKLVNKCLLHMMHRGMFLLRHLEYLKMVFLASQGDVFASLHEGIFNEDFQQTARDSSLQFLNAQLELAVRSSRPERHYRSRRFNKTKDEQSGGKFRGMELGVNLAQLISEDGTELTKLRFVQSGRSNQFNNNPNFFFTISNIGEYVRLDYQTDHPLDRVISQQCMSKYNVLFFFLLKLKRVNYSLTLIWKELNSAEFKRISSADFKELRKIQFLWQQMQYFLRTIDEYIMVAVIQSQWTILKQKLGQINYFEELISLHNAYLDTILEKCFLARARDNRLKTTMNQIFEFVFKLHFLIRNYGVGICRDYQAKQDMQNIQNQFRDYSRFMYQIVRNMSHKGQFKELFIRLDFNKFYQNTAVGSAGATSMTRNIIQ